MLRILVLACGVCGLLCGCGTAPPPCTLLPVSSVDPQSAVADHGAKAPGDRRQFTETTTFRGSAPYCPAPTLAVLDLPNWVVSDAVNVSISSAKDATNGLATCLGATSGPVTVTALASVTTPAATATLTCR